MKKLLFVYNADSSLFAKVTDFAHKIMSPDTYSCNLCALTYGNFSIETAWKDFIDGLDVPLEFLYKDGFAETYADFADEAMPAVFGVAEDESLELLITAEEINGFTDLDSLIKAVRAVVNRV